MNSKVLEDRLNKRIALFENMLDIQINFLETMANKNDLALVFKNSFAFVQLSIRRKALLSMPTAEFKKGGY